VQCYQFHPPQVEQFGIDRRAESSSGNYTSGITSANSTVNVEGSDVFQGYKATEDPVVLQEEEKIEPTCLDPMLATLNSADIQVYCDVISHYDVIHFVRRIIAGCLISNQHPLNLNLRKVKMRRRKRRKNLN
jgi:hypothetical protein